MRKLLLIIVLLTTGLLNAHAQQRKINGQNIKDTEQQVARLAEIAHQRHLKSIVEVSDGTHLFRIRELCRLVGLDV